MREATDMPCWKTWRPAHSALNAMAVVDADDIEQAISRRGAGEVRSERERARAEQEQGAVWGLGCLLFQPMRGGERAAASGNYCR